MITLILFSCIFFHNSLGQKCTNDLLIDSMFTFTHNDSEKLIAAKIITYGDNASISCLITNKTGDEFKLNLKKNFEWVFKSHFQIEIEPKKVEITQQINFTETFTQTNDTVYVTGLCNELQIYRFVPEAVGIYSCVPKEGFRGSYDKYVQVEIFVDGEVIEPKINCPSNLSTIEEAKVYVPKESKGLYLRANHEKFYKLKRKPGIKSEHLYVSSLEEECSPCYGINDPLNLTGTMTEKNSCVVAYYVPRNESVESANKKEIFERRYFTLFHSCEILTRTYPEGPIMKRTSCLNTSECVPELCPFSVEVKPIDLAYNFSVNLGYRKSPKFKIDPNDLNIASYIEEPEGYNVEMKCPMANITDLNYRGRIHWYKCNLLCDKITKSRRNYTRYNINQSEKTLKILKLEPYDTGKFACVRNKIILGALSFRVTPALDYYDIRSPLGSMIASSVFVLFLYVVLLFIRVYLKYKENSAAKKKNKTQNKGDHKYKKYKKLPKHA